MAKRLGINGRVVGGPGKVTSTSPSSSAPPQRALSEGEAPCCCTTEPPPSGCTACQTQSLFCGNSCIPGFGGDPERHAIMSNCSSLEIISTAVGLGLQALNGHTISSLMAPTGTNGVHDNFIAWSPSFAECISGNDRFVIDWSWLAQTSSGASQFCANQFGCTEYTGAASSGFLRIRHINIVAGIDIIRQQLVHRPVNPCDPGVFDFGFAQVRMFHPIPGSTGFSTGSCDGPPPDPTGSCCLPDGSCVTATQIQCENLSGTWTLNGSCTPNPCPQPPDPLGACCGPGGVCNITTQALCHGTWLGPNTTCTPNPCGGGPQTGACCIPQGNGTMVCVDGMTQAQCGTSNGTWFPGQSCGSVTCPDPVGACCIGGQCFNMTASQCAAANGIFTGPPHSCADVECNFGFRQGEWNTSMPSRGIGDTVAKFTHTTGIHAARQSKIAKKILGPCKCNKRQNDLNQKYSYKGK